MKITQEQVDDFLGILRDQLLGAADVRLEIQRGVVKREDWNTGQYVHTPTDGYTYTINLNGGAKTEVGEPIP